LVMGLRVSVDLHALAAASGQGRSPDDDRIRVLAERQAGGADDDRRFDLFDHALDVGETRLMMYGHGDRAEPPARPIEQVDLVAVGDLPGNRVATPNAC